MSTGLISDIQRFCIHDGPGIRTTVFFKGCPLRCLWCHNPETHRYSKELMFYPEKCIGCGECLAACPRHAIVPGEDRVDRSKCLACGTCAATCYAEALVLCGKEMTVEAVVQEVVKDTPFYHTSGGGVTLSGGEPTLQAAFALDLLDQLGELGLHRAMESSGHTSEELFPRFLERLELLLIDLKALDASLHKKLTGVSNKQILRNIELAITEWDGPVLLRTPMIPGLNDSCAEMASIAEHLQGLAVNSRGPLHVELLKYNHLAPAKYPRLGLAYELEIASEKQQDTPYMEVRRDIFRDRGLHVI